MPASLPQELFDTITDWVARLEPDSESLSSLKTLALTSRQYFTNRAQSHLFRMMIVAQDEINGTMNILESNTALFTHVRSFAIALQFTHPDDHDSQASESEEEFYRSMLRVVGYLHNITSLVILCLKSEATGTRPSEWATWRRISPACREMLNKSFEKTSINTLFVLGLRDIPVWKIHALPNLTMVLLEKYSGFTTEDLEGSEVMPRFQGHLPLDLVPKSVKWMSFHRAGLLAAPLIPSLCNIPHLTLEIAGVDQHIAAWDILGSGPPRLESLVLGYTNRISVSRRNANLLSECMSEFKRAGRNLPTLPRLRYLAMTANAFYDSSESGWLVPAPRLVPGFFVALIGHNPQPKLEVAEITLQWGIFVDPSGSLPPGAPSMISRECAEWAQLDEMLSSRRHFPHLRAVRAVPSPEIKAWNPHYPVTKDMEEDFEKRVAPQAKEEMLSVFTKVGEKMVVDVDLVKEVTMHVDGMIRRVLPEGFLDRVESMLA